MRKIHFMSMLVAVATLLSVASCSKDEDKPVELSAQQKAEMTVKALKGANTGIETTKVDSSEFNGYKSPATNQDVKADVSVETKVENGSPLVILYFGYSDKDSKNTNNQEYFYKFVPTIKVLDENRIEVSGKGDQVKDFFDYTGGHSLQGTKEGNKFTDIEGNVMIYDDVKFEYNKQTHTINNISITYKLTGDVLNGFTTVELKNLPLDNSKAVVKFGESHYKFGYGRPQSSLTARSSSSVLSGVLPIHIEMEGISGPAKVAQSQFKPDGDHYAKFTPLADGSIKMELCNANGLTNGGDPKVDNFTGFATPTMPMRLYFLDVKLYNQNGVITDAQGGNNYIKAMKRKDKNQSGFPGWIFGLINPNGQESHNAEILPTTLGQDPKHDILMNPHLPLDFRAHITIN